MADRCVCDLCGGIAKENTTYGTDYFNGDKIPYYPKGWFHRDQLGLLCPTCNNDYNKLLKDTLELFINSKQDCNKGNFV